MNIRDFSQTARVRGLSFVARGARADGLRHQLGALVLGTRRQQERENVLKVEIRDFFNRKRIFYMEK